MNSDKSNHLKTVKEHRKFVRKLCFMCGLYKQGIKHDLSKFSRTEFSESVKFWSGKESPIDACKRSKGYSEAWFHHRGRNKHHYEYWVDNLDNGGVAVKMPWEYAIEMVCDSIAACIVYSGTGKFDIDSELSWWSQKRRTAKLHEETRALVDIIFNKIKLNGLGFLCNKKEMYRLRREYEDGDILALSYKYISDSTVDMDNQVKMLEDYIKGFSEELYFNVLMGKLKMYRCYNSTEIKPILRSDYQMINIASLYLQCNKSGKNLSIKDLSESSGIAKSTLNSRLHKVGNIDKNLGKELEKVMSKRRR